MMRKYSRRDLKNIVLVHITIIFSLHRTKVAACRLIMWAILSFLIITLFWPLPAPYFSCFSLLLFLLFHTRTHAHRHSIEHDLPILALALIQTSSSCNDLQQSWPKSQYCYIYSMGFCRLDMRPVFLDKLPK